MADPLPAPSSALTGPPLPAVPPAVARPGLWARLLPPLTEEQAAILAAVRMPCC
jgi:hypothetical protein